MIREWLIAHLVDREAIVKMVSAEVKRQVEEEIAAVISAMQSKYSDSFFPVKEELKKETAADLLKMRDSDEEKLEGCRSKTAETALENAYVLEHWSEKEQLFRITSPDGSRFRVEQRDSVNSKKWEPSPSSSPFETTSRGIRNSYLFHVCYNLRQDFIKATANRTKSLVWVDIDPDRALLDKIEDI